MTSDRIIPRIRTAERSELPMLVDWAAGEGWNPGLDDEDAFWAADPEGFLVAEVDGEIVCSVSAVRYGDDFGFIGFYICRPEWRGKGIGFQLWSAGIDFLEGRIVGLDGVVAQQANYRKSGFTYVHGNKRFAGACKVEVPTDPRLTLVGPSELDAILQYDCAFFPADRSNFLKVWLTPTKTRTAVALMETGNVTGYGAIRDCREGSKIGPLFANTAENAAVLFAALASRRAGRTIILDTPLPNPEAVALAHDHGLSPIFETARMYRGGLPNMPLDQIFGITTFELG